MPITLVGLSGSLRQGSYNTALLRAAAAAMPPDATLRVETLAGIPLYDGDEEARAVPPRVAELKALIAGADGLVLATPEYNNSVPGVAKNAIDWLSRPPADSAGVFGGKPVALMGASPGGFGTVLAQNAWLPVFKTLGASVWSGSRLMVSRAGAVFDARGDLVDAVVRESLGKFLAAFVAHVAALQSGRGAGP
jgi:NAD(P)H-dependent FMN reductase